MGTSGLHSSTFVTRTSAFLSLFPFCFCSSPGVAPLLTQTQRLLAGSLSECGLWSHSHKEQYALLTQTQRPLAGSLSECGLWSHSHKEQYALLTQTQRLLAGLLSECGLWSHSHKEQYVFMQQSCSFSWFSWLHILRQSGELKGNRTGCWNESPFVKSESVTCSVVSDSLRPHGLYPPQAPLSMAFSLQARILEWVILPFSRGSSQPV